jgi:hypothetical protein
MSVCTSTANFKVEGTYIPQKRRMTLAKVTQPGFFLCFVFQPAPLVHNRSKGMIIKLACFDYSWIRGSAWKITEVWGTHYMIEVSHDKAFDDKRSFPQSIVAMDKTDDACWLGDLPLQGRRFEALLPQPTSHSFSAAEVATANGDLASKEINVRRKTKAKESGGRQRAQEGKWLTTRCVHEKKRKKAVPWQG